MVEKFGFESPRAESFDEASRLPIRAIVHAFVKREDADFGSCHGPTIPAS
jgi:hypothetical protein